MKRKAIMTTVLSLAIVTGGFGLAQAHGGQSRGGSGSGWFGMGSGHMGGSGWGHMGSGNHMMGSGWDHMGGFDRGFDGSVFNGPDNRRQSSRPVTREEARDIAEHNLGGNPYIKVGSLTESGEGFEVEIVTRKGGKLVNRLLVEKKTGRAYPIYE
jgi:hypothetical protein